MVPTEPNSANLPAQQPAFEMRTENPMEPVALMDQIFSDFMELRSTPESPIPAPGQAIDAAVLLRRFASYADWWIAKNVGSFGETVDQGLVVRMLDGTPLSMTKNMERSNDVQPGIPPEPLAVPMNFTGAVARSGRPGGRMRGTPTVQMTGTGRERPRIQ
jgi:hypothetical protein